MRFSIQYGYLLRPTIEFNVRLVTCWIEESSRHVTSPEHIGNSHLGFNLAQPEINYRNSASPLFWVFHLLYASLANQALVPGWLQEKLWSEQMLLAFSHEVLHSVWPPSSDPPQS